MSAAPQTNGVNAQYPTIKRKKPQQKKEKDPVKETKSNPSKRHRDRLNLEIENISQLIPFPEEVIEKLDKLSILRLAVAYLRNKNYHAAEDAACGVDNEHQEALSTRNQLVQVACFNEPESKLALEALNGFLLVVTQDFNVLYVSETIQNYLGYPQSDVMNQSILDLIHAEDRDIFMRHIQIYPSQAPGSPPKEGELPTVPEYMKFGMAPAMFRGFSREGLFHRSFICRLRCLLDNSSGFLALHFTGHLRLVPGQNKKNDQKVQLPPETGLFLLASPLQTPSILEIRTKNLIFRTKHRLDYTPLGIDSKGTIVLGYTEQQIRRRSGYEFIHSADMMHCADAHTKLMRKGESGLTVFRLLHKDNRWLWVTASAKLVFRDGRPDFIIATQRPILDQEGEEHMKKRTNAFRFDFTGQAILYGEVNPIGTQGGPENNPLTENNQVEPLAKRQRLTQQDNNIDRKSLYGAQAMQRLDIYAGSMPHQSSELYAKSENLSNVGQPSDSNVTFYPFRTSDDVMHPPMQRNQANCQSSDVYQPLPSNLTPPAPYAMENQPRPAPRLRNQMSMEGNTNSEYHSPGTTQLDQQHLYHSSVQSTAVATTNGQARPNPLKRPFPTQSNAGEVQQTRMLGHSQRLPSTGEAMPSANYVIKPEECSNRGQYNDYQHINRSSRNPQTAVSHMQFARPETHAAESGTPMSQRPDQQFSSYVHDQQQNFLQSYGQNPSVIESMTINSYLDINQEGSVADGTNRHVYMPANEATLPIRNRFNEPQLVARQDNTIQFDLQKIAAEFQTTDPLSKVQEYLHDNPSHAMAIATGQVPEAGMPQLRSNEITAYMLNYQIQPQMQHENVPINRQRMTSNNSIGKSINSSCSSLNQNFNMSDSDPNQVSPSISSVDSYPSTNNHNIEKAAGDYFVPPEGSTVMNYRTVTLAEITEALLNYINDKYSDGDA